MSSLCGLTEREYNILQGLAQFPKRKDGFRYRLGRIAEDNELPIVDLLESRGAIYTGYDDGLSDAELAATDPDADLRIRTTISITQSGELWYKAAKERKLIYSDRFWDRVKGYFHVATSHLGIDLMK